MQWLEFSFLSIENYNEHWILSDIKKYWLLIWNLLKKKFKFRTNQRIFGMIQLIIIINKKSIKKL